jgi:hypothetical protein
MTTPRIVIAVLFVACGFVTCNFAGNGVVAARRGQIAANGMVIQVVTIAKQDAPTILRRVQAVLARETKVPVRWPSFIPAETSAERPLFVNLLTEGRDNYNMELGWTSDCIGGGYCHYGSIRASADAPSEPGHEQVAVKLRDGISGYFTDSKSCGPRCDDATVAWSEDGYQYSIRVKAEKKETLIKVADSAIASGHALRDQEKRESGALVQ